VAVVIPTRGRTLVREAVASALAQSLPPSEVIVVVDDRDTTSVENLVLTSPEVRLMATGGALGGNVARMTGARASTADYVAFLDDDDRWLPEKLECQARLLHSVETPHVVVSCRVALVDKGGAPTNIEWPRRLLRDGEKVSEYLFRRRQVRHGESLLHTSTLLCDRALLEQLPWRSDLVRHQDWDWMLDVDRPDVTIRMHPQALVEVREHSASVSHAAGWQHSMAWGRSRKDSLTRRELGDFLLTHTAPVALLEGHRAALTVGIHAVRCGRPGLPAWLFFVAQMCLPRRALTRFARALTLRGREVSGASR
jgi:hypothetical protein